MLRESDEVDVEEALRFYIGCGDDVYTKIDSAVINTNHSFFFSNDTKLRMLDAISADDLRGDKVQ